MKILRKIERFQFKKTIPSLILKIIKRIQLFLSNEGSYLRRCQICDTPTILDALNSYIDIFKPYLPFPFVSFHHILLFVSFKKSLIFVIWLSMKCKIWVRSTLELNHQDRGIDKGERKRNWTSKSSVDIELSKVRSGERELISSKEGKGTSSLYSSEFCDEERDDDDDKKVHSSFVGVGNVLLKLSIMEEVSLGSSMMWELDKFPQVWWPYNSWSCTREESVEFYAPVWVFRIFDHTCEYTYSSSCVINQNK